MTIFLHNLRATHIVGYTGHPFAMNWVLAQPMPWLAEIMDRLIKSQGIASELVIIPGAGHGGFGADPNPLYQKIIAFLKTHLFPSTFCRNWRLEPRLIVHTL